MPKTFMAEYGDNLHPEEGAIAARLGAIIDQTIDKTVENEELLLEEKEKLVKFIQKITALIFLNTDLGGIAINGLIRKGKADFLKPILESSEINGEDALLLKYLIDAINSN